MATVSDFLLRVQVAGIDLVDKLKKSVDDVSKSFTTGADAATKFNEKSKQSSEGATKASEAIKGLSESILKAADGTSTFGAGAAQLISKLGPMGIIVGGAVTALGALFTHTINLADKLGDLSDSTGISASRLMSFKDSLLIAGGNSESMEKLATKLAVTLGQAADGSDKARYAFAHLGIDLGDANGKLRSTDELLPEVIEALKKIENPAERAATAVELMGKSAAKIDFSKVEAIKDVFKDEEIKKLGEYRDAIDELANAIENKLLTAFGKIAIAGSKGGFFEGLAASIEQVGYLMGKIPGFGFMDTLATKAERERLGAAVGGGRGGQGGPTAAQIASVTSGTAPTGATGALALTDEAKRVQESARITTELLKQQDSITATYAMRLNDTIGLRQTEGDILRATLTIDKERDAKLADINAQIKKESSVTEKERDKRVTSEIVGQLKAQGAEITANAEKMKMAKTDELVKLQQQKDLISDIMLLNQMIAQDAQTKQIGNQNSLIGLYGDELKLKQDLMKVENDRVNAVIAAEAKLAALGKNATQADQDRANREISQANRVADERVQIAKDAMSREQATREDANLGAAKAFDDIAKSMKPMMNAQNAVNNMFNSMGNAIDKFVETGKFSFGDLATAMIQDILKIELRAQATKVFSGIFGSGGLFGDIFGSIFGKAVGGPVNENTPYIVGERGPELFMPRTSGQIIPNNAMATGTTTTTHITNNYNVSAIDQRSVAQFFAENRRTMLGSVQLAQKELPYSNR